MISNDGQFVVTFDNWFGIGKDPIVVYGKNGVLIKRHTLGSLSLVQYTDGQELEDGWTSEDLIRTSISSIYWNQNALLFLNSSQSRLIARLHWGHIFGIQLENGNFLAASEIEDEKIFIDEHVRLQVETLLNSVDELELDKGIVNARSAGLSEFEGRIRVILRKKVRDLLFSVSSSLSDLES